MSFKQQFSDIKEDLWSYLNDTQKPVAIYGMGDGADKIIDVLEKRGIKISGVFASDGFVRKKVFRGFTLESYSAIKARLSDFIVLLSFATSLDDVLENINRIAHEQELYAPDVPVYGTGLFDMDYFLGNIKRLENVYDKLSDDISKKTFINSIKFRLTGKISYLFECETPICESYTSLLIPAAGCHYVDIGAYSGDTIREFISFSGENIKVTAFEPDARSYKKLLVYSESLTQTEISCHNAAAWDKNEELTFFARSGRNSSKEKNNHTNKETMVSAVALDNIINSADFIKIDAEGSELNVIDGMKNLIKNSMPSMNIAAYHRTEDYFAIPEKVLSVTDGYNLYFRHFKYVPSWDTNFYFIKKELH